MRYSSNNGGHKLVSKQAASADLITNYLPNTFISSSAFDNKQPLRVPVLKFLSEPGQAYTGKTVGKR